MVCDVLAGQDCVNCYINIAWATVSFYFSF